MDVIHWGAVAPLSVVDTTICMGSQCISSLHGMESQRKRIYQELGRCDRGSHIILHTGVNSLMNMMYNKATEQLLF